MFVTTTTDKVVKASDGNGDNVCVCAARGTAIMNITRV